MSKVPTYDSGGGPLFAHSRFEGPVHFDKVQWPRTPRTIPRAVNSLFTGREDIRDQLKEAFLTRKSGESTKGPRRFVISGLGGTGKSEVCIKYATEHQSNYWGLFWIDCKDHTTAVESFKRIGRLCGVNEPNIASVKDLLSSIHERWLLIIDNADDITVNYSSYLPFGGNGDIIVTTRNPELCELYATIGSIRLEQLETPLARKLLLRSASVPSTDWDSMEKVATEIVEELGNHTLALIHAGAYIKQQCSIDEYLNIFSRRRDALFNIKRYQEEATYGTVHTTFEVSFSKLEEIRENGNVDERTTAGDALDLITTLAFMHYEGAIEQIFSAAVEHAVEIEIEAQNDDDDDDDHDDDKQKFHGFQDILSLGRAHTANLPEFLPKISDNSRPFRWNNACRMLNAFSFIATRQQDGTSIIYMHSLTHKWVKERLYFVTSTRKAFEAQCQAWQEAVRLLALSTSEDHYKPHIYDLIKSHVHACLSHPIGLYSEELQSSSLLAVLFQLIWVQSRTGQYDALGQSVSILQVGILRAENLSDSSRKLAQARVRTFTAGRLCLFGDASQGFEELQRATGSLATLLDEVEYALVASPQEPTDASTANERCLTATDFLDDRISMEEEVYDEASHAQLASQHVLSVPYHVQAERQFRASIRLLERATRYAKKRFGARNPFSIQCQFELGKAYLKVGQIEAAITILEPVARVQEETLDATNHKLLESQHVLAVAYKENEEIDLAIELLEHVTNARAQKLIEANTHRLESQEALADAYLASGQIEAAVKLLEHIVRVREETLEEKHYERLFAQHALGVAYRKNGQTEMAIKVLEHVITVMEKELDEANPHRHASENQLALAYKASRQFEKSLKMYQHLLDVSRKTFHEADTYRLAIEYNLAGAHTALGQYEEAIRLYEHVAKVEAHTLSNGDPSYLTTLQSLEEVYTLAGHSERATQLRAKITRIEAGGEK